MLYDPCAEDKNAVEDTGILGYVMDPTKFYNCNPRRNALGTVGGNNVSLYKGNLVDLDSDLSGRTRRNTRCPTKKYHPGTIVQGKDAVMCTPASEAGGLPCGKAGVHSGKLVHLPEYQLIDYKPRPDNVGYTLDFAPCATNGYTPQVKDGSRKNPYSPNEWVGNSSKVHARY
jgi:hypothetical protein